MESKYFAFALSFFTLVSAENGFGLPETPTIILISFPRLEKSGKMPLMTALQKVDTSLQSMTLTKVNI